MPLIPIPLTPEEKLEQLKVIAARLERFLRLETPSPMFFDDLQELLKLILENDPNKEKTIGNA